MIKKIKGYFSKEDEYEEEDYNEEDYNEEETNDEYDFEDDVEEENQESDFKGFGEDLFSKEMKKKLSVILLSPNNFNDSIRISDELKKNKIVIVNLEEIEFEEARKILDFVSGTVYALGGSVNKISSKIFIFAPIFIEVQNTINVRRKDTGMEIPSFRRI